MDNPLEVAAVIVGKEEGGLPKPSAAALAFICKRLHLNYTKLIDKEELAGSDRGGI